MTNSDNKKRHFSKEQICQAIKDKETWIALINSVCGTDITGKKEGEPCPVCCAGTNRFVFDNSRGNGNNLCRKCDGGDGKGAKSRTGLRLIADILNISFGEACERAGDWLSLTPEQQHFNTHKNSQTPQNIEPSITEKDKEFAKKIIEEIWQASGSIEGTAAIEYLRERGLRADYPINNVRFGKIERFEKDEQGNNVITKQNALIGVLTDPEGKLESLQRTYLTDKNQKDCRKQTPKLTGRSMLEAQASVKLFDAAEVMGIAEGIETALAAHELTNLPVWASINAGRLEAWQPPSNVKTVFIFADLDESNTGYDRAAKLYHRLKAQGIDVYLLLPGTVIPQGKKSVDFLDFHKSVRGLSYTTTQLKSMAIAVPAITEKEKGDNAYQEWKEVADIRIFPGAQVKTNQTTGRKSPKPTLDNLSRLMDYYKVQLKYNEITKQPEYTFPNAASFINEGEDLKMNAAHGQIVDLMTINNMPITNLDAYLQTLQQKHTYNPVKDWIYSKPWDGRHDYISDLLNTVTVNLIGTDEPEKRNFLKERLITKWLLGACALAVDLIDELPFVLVFQSTKQGIGKTYWFRKLCPNDWRVDGVTLEVGNVDSEREALSHWLCELGEVDGTIKKSSMESIKSFLSKTSDILRTPYAKYANTFKRRTAFFGTCNPTEFLRDDENRRFWVIPVTKVDSYHNVDMQQVWAQCLHLLRNGETHLLTIEESQALLNSNQEFLPEHPIEAGIRQTFDIGNDNKNFRQLTPQEILKECGFTSSDRQKYMRICGRYLQKFFGDKHRSNGRTLYNVPPLLPGTLGNINTDPLGGSSGPVGGNNLWDDGDIPF